MGGPPPWVAQMFGADFAGRGPGGGGRRRPRVRRGDVRSAILDVLYAAREPVNGYQVIQQIAERTDGVWKPSPGSVYPTIAQLEDEGLVEDAPTGRKAIQLTAEGTAYVEGHAEEMAAVWAPFAAHDDDVERSTSSRSSARPWGPSSRRCRPGPPTSAECPGILVDTRRRIYGLLADGPHDPDEDHRGV